MTAQRIYLDHNATSPLRPSARTAMLAALATAGNASSVHYEGRAARTAVETAREKVAALFCVDPRTVTFTSGATEANALALSPEFQLAGRPEHFDVLLISAMEHPSVRSGGRFSAAHVDAIPVDGDGVVDLAALAVLLERCRGKNLRPLVSVMAASNETGVVQPIAEITRLVHAANGTLHSDAVQIAGRLPFDIASSGADLISVSSHKLGGPQGVGALIARDEDVRPTPVTRGGGQEFGRRPGTENVAAIAGFGAAAEQACASLAAEAERLAGLRDAAEEGLRTIAADVVILSAGAQRLPNTLCFAAPGIAAETAVIALDLDGVAVSAGAACSSGKIAASEALAAMRVPAGVARGALRVSLGWNTSENDISRFLEVWKRVYLNLGQCRRGRAA